MNLIMLQRCCLLAAAVWIQLPAHALEPCIKGNPYRQAVDKIIDGAVGHPPALALTVLPSFETEYGVRIVGNDVYLVRMRTSIWSSTVVEDDEHSYHHDFRRAQASTAVNKAPLSPELVKRLTHRFSAAIAGAKASNAGGLDGTIYHFASPLAGCGQAWSPQAGTADGKLVALTDLLVEHAQLRWSFFMRRSEANIMRAVSDAN